jgi:hypothetical protein
MLSATLGFPNGTSKPIPGFFGQFLQSDSYQTETALNAGYPAGNYQWSIELGRRVQPYTFTMAVPAQFTSVPAFTNLTNFAAANPTQDFTLGWAAFAGATANDGI